MGILRFQKSLNLKVESNYLHYQDVLQAVTARAMGINMEQLPLDVQTALEIGKVRKRLVAEKTLAKKAERGEDVPTLDISHGVVGAEGEELDIAQMYAVERIQAAFRGRKARRLAKEKAEREAEERARYKAETVLAHVKELMRDVEQTNERRARGGSRGDSGRVSARQGTTAPRSRAIRGTGTRRACRTEEFGRERADASSETFFKEISHTVLYTAHYTMYEPVTRSCDTSCGCACTPEGPRRVHPSA